MSKLVGDKGFVFGIDMTAGQIRVAETYLDVQTKRFATQSPTCRFIFDDIEQCHTLPGGSLDLVISNCVINLVCRQGDIIRQIYKMLKPGGEFYFSDIYADRRIPEALKKDPVLHGECLGGALYDKDFVRHRKKEPGSPTRASCPGAG